MLQSVEADFSGNWRTERNKFICDDSDLAEVETCVPPTTRPYSSYVGVSREVSVSAADSDIVDDSTSSDSDYPLPCVTKTSNLTDNVSRHPNNINYSFADVVNTNESIEDQHCESEELFIDADSDEPFTSVPTDKPQVYIPAETANVDITESDEDECLVLSEVHCANHDKPSSSATADDKPVTSEPCETATAEQRSKKPVGSVNKTKSSLTLLSKRKPKPGRKNSYDKIHYCLFCNKSICSKMSRHLVRKHKDEQRVKEALHWPEGSKQRVFLLQCITNEGNFHHNVSVMSLGVGHIVVGRRNADAETEVSDYTVCTFCKKWQSRRNLWRHSQKCPARILYFQQTEGKSCETSPGKNYGTKKRLLAVKAGQSFIAKSLCDPDDDILGELISRMKDDSERDCCSR